MSCTITPESVVAYSQCPRKAFFLLRGEPGHQHEYEKVLKERASANRSSYLSGLSGNELVSNPLHAGDLVATCDALVRKSSSANRSHARYEPHLVVGTAGVSKEQKLALAYAGYVVGQTKRYTPDSGYVVPLDGRPRFVRLSSLYPIVRSHVASLRVYGNEPEREAPALSLIDHCSACPFRHRCLQEAQKSDNLTLLDRMTPKLVARYAKTGVFTVNQLSYLFKPRRYRKRSRAAQPSFNIELQALAIRTGKTYLHEPPSIEKQTVELFIDIEGIPDQDFHYLIGLLIKHGDRVNMRSFWSDSRDDERRMFLECIEEASRFPGAPVYHYGSYELRAFQIAATKYGLDCAAVTDRFVNANSFVFGKIYFPTRSNRLKHLGGLLGATWTATDASGVSSLAWRYRWEDTGQYSFKEMLLTYNQEDCEALRLVRLTINIQIIQVLYLSAL